MPETHSFQLSDLRPDIQFRQYRLIEQIGAGGQGVVWSARDQAEDRIVAIKLNEIALHSDAQKAEDQIFERQASHLVNLRHPCILPMYDYGLSGQIRYTVTPYIPGETLEDRLNAKPLSIDEILQFAAKIASALDYLHAQNVVHRDLKPGNILMDFSQNLYVADFGLARFLTLSTQAMHTGRGTPPYASPEQHAMSEIALQSDLYSFGIMLYEMFTGILPWNGEKILGIQQLHSNEEIPDPARINQHLPPGVVTVLRQLTAADPSVRPASAGEAMQSIYTLFQMQPIGLDTQNASDESSRRDDVAEKILEDSLARWEPREGTVVLGLTKFAYVELTEKRIAAGTASLAAKRFMLHSALTFGYDDDFWWAQITDSQERLSIASHLISRDNPAITARVIRHLIDDSDIHALKLSLSEGVMESLLEMALNADDLSFREQVIQFLRIFTPLSTKWRSKVFVSEQDLLLARLALEDSELGDASARLIGQMRSTLAVEDIVKTASEDRRTGTLLTIQKIAGSLPGSVPLKVRLEVLVEWVAERLASQQTSLLQAYILIFTGAAISAGLQVYLTYRLPNFIDLGRVTVSVERGIFLGATLGLGILLVKLIVESFPEAKAVFRAALASIVGGLILSISFSIYDTLFLNTIPGGILMLAGCLLLACGYAVAGLATSRVWKILISYIGCLSALAVTWFLHVNLAATPAVLTPIFVYEYTWSAVKVFQVMLIVALPMAVMANLIHLFPKKE